MSETERKVLVMYDVRGIQNYIFRTSKLKDAIGASALVEDIISTTLTEAVKYHVDHNGKFLNYELEWFNGDGPLPYEEKDIDVAVLYIGGGNAYVLMRNRSLAVSISKEMSRLVIEKTYSLQLATAIVDVTDNYHDDYEALNEEMTRVKANMIVSKPIGALPIMEVENKTGYPAIKKDGSMVSRETLLKQAAAERKRSGMQEEEKKMESYITEKEVDSTIAVVHIDGNNMGLRIRNLVEGITDYTKAVNVMRDISYRIDNSFKHAFEEMKEFFNNAASIKAFAKKANDYYLVKVLVAGDDITYVCNGKVALATVEYFAKQVSKEAMIGEEKLKEIGKGKVDDYHFSVCAGIAFIGSHFPFNIAYDVAESCCGKAKNAAKDKKNMENDQIGNWFDFMFCRNVQTRNLDDMREREYKTWGNEQLLTRPYFIPVADYKKGSVFAVLAGGKHSLYNLKHQLEYFTNEGSLPRSQAKNLRNTYPLGKGAVDMLMNFLNSREAAFPDNDGAYYEEGGMTIANYYDALELMDMYVGLEEIQRSAQEA